jgi:hypothetical protein
LAYLTGIFQTSNAATLFGACFMSPRPRGAVKGMKEISSVQRAIAIEPGEK